MKRFLCVALLMGLTTALHAVTYNWDKNTKAFTDDLGNKFQAYKNISTLVITVECTRSTDTITKDFFAITQQDGTNLLKFGVAGDADPFSDKAQVTVTNNSALTGIPYSYWTSDRAGNDNSLTTMFTFNELNSQNVFQTLVADYTFTTADVAKSDTWTTGVNADFNGKSFDNLTVFDGTTIVSASIEIEGEPVPEPGLLALLALGGAGLVLRRRRKVRV